MRYLFIFSLLVLSCQQPAATNTKISDFDWLVGEWQRETMGRTHKEIWTKVDNKHYQAIGFNYNAKDTAMQEKIILEQRSDGIYFIPTVIDQNEGHSVEFRLVSDSAGIFVFENKKHDFPTRIVYSHPDTNRIYAWIEGKNNGKPMKIDFNLHRVR